VPLTFTSDRMEHSSLNDRDQSSDFGVLLFCFLLGLWLTFGGAMALYHGEWFPLFPPQLDIFNFVESLVSKRAGAYLEGALAVVIGVALVAFAVTQSCKNHDV
jgi:hypothetical protein